MNKGIISQLKDNSEYNARKGITLEDLKNIRDYVFKYPSNKEVPNNLYIVHNDGQLYFKTSEIIVGLEDFKNIYKLGYVLGIENVYYNGDLLNEEQRREVFNKLLK